MYVKTKRLELRPLRESDRDRTVQLLMDDAVKQTYMLPDFENEEKAEALFRRLMDLSETEGRYVAAISRDGELVGFLNDVEIEGDSIELGYVIHPDHWGRGYMTEALDSAIGELFRLGFRQVITGAFETNLASIRVMEKSGMEKLGKTDAISYRGKTHRCVYYAARFLKLIQPEEEDLWFKRELLGDGATMSYNAQLGGCLDFPEERWSAWHQKWIGDGNPDYFYRYLFSSREQAFVGEIAYHREGERYLCDVIVLAKYRGRGYGACGLELLCRSAKANGVTELYDDILPDNPSVNMFLKNGFMEVSREEAAVIVKKIL